MVSSFNPANFIFPKAILQENAETARIFSNSKWELSSWIDTKQSNFVVKCSTQDSVSIIFTLPLSEMYDVQIILLLRHFPCRLFVNIDVWIALWTFFGYNVINVHAIRFDPSFVIYKIFNYLLCHRCLNVYRQAIYVWNCHLCFKYASICHSFCPSSISWMLYSFSIYSDCSVPKNIFIKCSALIHVKCKVRLYPFPIFQATM